MVSVSETLASAAAVEKSIPQVGQFPGTDLDRPTLRRHNSSQIRHSTPPTVPVRVTAGKSYAFNHFHVHPRLIVAPPLHYMGSGTTPREIPGVFDGKGRRNNVAKEDRGFASMDRAKQREIASKGGKAAHQKGTAHEWTSEEARDAGRKGGIASHQRRREMQSTGGTDTGRSADEDVQNRGREGSGLAREDSTSKFGGNERDDSER